MCHRHRRVQKRPLKPARQVNREGNAQAPSNRHTEKLRAGVERRVSVCHAAAAKENQQEKCQKFADDPLPGIMFFSRIPSLAGQLRLARQFPD